jgi:hypothetical protein
MLRVRTLPGRSLRLNFLTFLYALFGGIAAFAASVFLENPGAAAGVSFLLFLPFIYLLCKGGKQKREARVCLECQNPLPSPLQNSMASGEPILHHCKKCEILWFAGSTSSD